MELIKGFVKESGEETVDEYKKDRDMKETGRE